MALDPSEVTRAFRELLTGAPTHGSHHSKHEFLFSPQKAHVLRQRCTLFSEAPRSRMSTLLLLLILLVPHPATALAGRSKNVLFYQEPTHGLGGKQVHFGRKNARLKFRRFWVEEPRPSFRTIFFKKYHLYRSTRLNTLSVLASPIIRGTYTF